MTPIQIIILIASIILGSGVIFGIFCIFFISYQVYSSTLTKKKGEQWGRNQPSDPTNEELVKMWNDGLSWSKENIAFKKDVEITSQDNLRLVGEFYDFGFDKTVIICPGRRECLVYSYFYAYPYKNMCVNVLVIDQRAHGESEGNYSTGGIVESDDVRLWMEYLNKSHNQKEFYLHGICVGTSCVSIIGGKNTPDYVKGIILDSTFITYKEIYKRHYVESGHALFPVYYLIWMWFYLKTKHHVDESMPIKYIKDFNVPTLFIWGEKDVYCLPVKSKEIFENCSSKDKTVEWFKDATHSHVRYNNPQRYDKIVSNFIKNH